MKYNLDEMTAYWETRTIEKQAAIKTLVQGTGKALKGSFDFVKALADFTAKNVIKPAAWTLPITASLLAVAANRMTAPHVVAKNADKRVLLNALDTEIAVLRRQIAEEEERRATLEQTDKKYDRFI